MGYNNEHARGPLVVDIETVPIDLAAEFVPPPDLESIQAAKNLKDPAKIQEDIQKRRAEATATHAQSLGRAGLDFNLARIVAIGWSDGGEVIARTCVNECAEREALEEFWRESAHTSLVGFRIRTFDAPMLMARSRYLEVRYPLLDLGRYSRGGRVTDLWDVLTFGLSDYETTCVMPRRLKTYAKRYGLTVNDEVDGKDIAGLVAADDWNAVRSHVTSDVQLTVELARRLGVLRAVAEAVTA